MRPETYHAAATDSAATSTRTAAAAIESLRSDERRPGRASVMPALSRGSAAGRQRDVTNSGCDSASGRARGDRDLPDMTQAAVPLPVTYKEFAVDLRFLEASRLLGNGIDTTTAIEAARVVAESLEYMLFNGDSGVNFQGSTIYGYTTHPSRNTDTATNYGGGDWGTVTNIIPTVAGMLRAASNTSRHYGPYVLYVSETQYDQAAQSFFTDGTAETALMRLNRSFGMGADGTKQISAVKKVPAPVLADGSVLLVQMTPDVVTWAETMAPMTREWRTGDGMEVNWRVMTIAAPKIKARLDGKSGIVHATSA